MTVTELRPRAFLAHGVTLKYPAFSSSGVREGDGTVVFSIEASEVRMDQSGYCSVLWMPARSEGGGTLERASNDERLQHCLLALRNGRGEGFVLDERCESQAEILLDLRILVSGEKYWARWGTKAGVPGPGIGSDNRQAA